MAIAKQRRTIDSDEVYTVTLNVPGANLSSIIEGLPADFTVEQAILFRLFRDAEPRGFNAGHFREWSEAFDDALTELTPLKVKKRERIDPIPPLAPKPPTEKPSRPKKPAKKVVGTGKRAPVKKKR
jgi:hypothetical protein